MFNLTVKWERKVRDYCDSQYKIIDVLPGEINYYLKCHMVATHYAVENNHDELALVVYRGKSDLKFCVHFVNFTGVDFVDNSIGVWAEKTEYRLIRMVHKDEFFNTTNILIDTQSLFKNMAGFWTRKFVSELNN